MQIKASRRQTTAQTGRRPHEVLARHWALQRRLFTGGVLALVVSVVVWLFGVTLPVHLGLVGVGFIVGFFWRFTRVGRRAQRWAFSWIEVRAGLSYLTAYELAQTELEPEVAESPSAEFGEAVRARAAQVGRLETPALQPWALPLVVLALALAILPHALLPTWRAPLAPLTARLPLPAPQTELPQPNTGFTAAPEPETGTPPAKTPETGSEAANRAENGTGDSGTDPDTGTNLSDAAAPSESGAAEGERSALESFLEQRSAARTGASPGTQAQGTQSSGTQAPGTQAPGRQARGAQDGAPQRNSSQRPPQTASSPNTAPTALPDAAQATTPPADTPNSSHQRGQSSATENGSAPQTAQRTPGDQGDAPAPGEGSPAGREPSAAQGQKQGQAGQSASEKEAGTSGSADSAQGKGQNAQTSQQGGSPAAQQPQSQAQSDQNGSQSSAAAGSGNSNVQRSAAQAGSQASKDSADGASSDRAGTHAGGELGSSRKRLGNASPQTPERVAGSRKNGPLSFSGETLRQGRAPDALPQTGSAAYRRAAEEVIREGRIPLEYQKIVRDYFR